MTVHLRHRVIGVGVAATVAMLSVLSSAATASAEDKAEISLAIQSPVTDGASISVGETDHIKLTVTNSGTVALTDVGVALTSDYYASGPKPAISCPGGTLAGGESQVCTTEYTLLQADADRGYTVMHFEATGGAAMGLVAITSSPSQGWYGVLTGSGWTVDVESDAPDQLVNPEGATVTYTITATNGWALDMREVAVWMNDEQLACPADTVAAKDKLTCTVTRTYTAADLAGGDITIRIHVTALLGGDTIPAILKDKPLDSGMTTYTLHAPTGPDVRFLSAAVDKATAKAGDKLTYTFTIQNSGNLSLSDLKLKNAKATGAGTAPDLAKATCAQDGKKVDLATLTLGYADKVTCTVTYVVTEKDNGTIAYQLTVSAQPKWADEDPDRVTATSKSLETKVAGKTVQAPTGGMALTGPAADAGAAGGMVLLAGLSMLVIGLRRRSAA